MEEAMHTQELHQRRLALEGSYNIRDLGGYTTLDGRLTRWRTVLRADSLNGLSLDSQRVLLAYPVRMIVDLRRTSEVRRNPSIFVDSPLIRYINLSVLEDEQKVREAPSLQMLYRLMLESCQEEIKQILQVLATEEVFPCLLHCTLS